jgi:hypothetical protein
MLLGNRRVRLSCNRVRVCQRSTIALRVRRIGQQGASSCTDARDWYITVVQTFPSGGLRGADH